MPIAGGPEHRRGVVMKSFTPSQNTSRFGLLLGAPALALLLGSATSASAASITITGSIVFTVNWLGTTPAPSGSATSEILNWTGTDFDLQIYDIQNTTSAGIQARLTSFGFGLTPDFSSYSTAVNGQVYSWGFSNFPGFQTVDVCGFAGQNCAGGSNQGLGEGQSTVSGDIMSIHFTGGFGSGVIFSPIPAKF